NSTSVMPEYPSNRPSSCTKVSDASAGLTLASRRARIATSTNTRRSVLEPKYVAVIGHPRIIDLTQGIHLSIAPLSNAKLDNPPAAAVTADAEVAYDVQQSLGLQSPSCTFIPIARNPEELLACRTSTDCCRRGTRSLILRRAGRCCLHSHRHDDLPAQ